MMSDEGRWIEITPATLDERWIEMQRQAALIRLATARMALRAGNPHAADKDLSMVEQHLRAMGPGGAQ